MDSIKKKMQSLANETASAVARFERWEREVTATNATADNLEEQVKAIQKKIQATESQFDVTTEDLFNQTIKLEEMEKKAGNAEGEVSALRSRLILLQENNEKQEDRLCKSTLELAGACKRADETGRLWCYTTGYGCSDARQSQRFPSNPWSYQACGSYSGK